MVAACLGILVAASLDTFGQNGDYFMSHYTHQSDKIDNTNFDIIQDEKGVISMANRAGILRFDGHVWDYISTESAVFSLAIDYRTNKLYGAGIDGFGVIEITEDNQYLYRQLSDTTIVGNIYQHYVSENKLIGLGDNVVYLYDLESSEESIIRSKYAGGLIELFQVDEEIFVSTENSGLLKVAGTNLDNVLYPELAHMNVEFISENDGQWLVGSTDNKLYLGAPHDIKLLELDDEDDYLGASELIDGLWVSDTLVAIATLKGGVIFVDIASRKISDIVDYESGLPDNEIYAFEKDSHGGLWVAHSAGFTRISPNLPFRSFHKYPGLEGNLLSVINHNDSIYVGTTLGLYLLSQVKKYETIVYYDKQTLTEEVEKQIEADTEDEDEKNKGGGLFGLFKKKKKDDGDEESKTETVTETVTKTVLNKKTRQVLKSVSYAFEKVEGLDAKVFHLATTDQGLFAAGLDGLFRINGAASFALTDEPINHFSIAREAGLILAATYDEYIRTFSLDPPHRQVPLFYDFRDDIQHIFEGENGRIWLTSNDELSYVTLEDKEIVYTESFNIFNPHYFQTLGYHKDGKTYFVNEDGEYLYNAEKSSISPIKGINPSRYLKGANGEIWVLTGEKWTHLGFGKNSDKLNLLSVFKNIRYIASESDEGHWVITQNNELFKITDSYGELVSPYDLYLKYVKTNDKTLSPNSAMRFEQGGSSFMFEFAQPEFSGILDVKYQYMLEGLNEEWSEWSGEYNVINFSYLPSGSYKLRVRSRSVLGDVKEIDPIEFEIVPPYWKRPWFYAFEFSAMAILLFISVRLKALGFRYRLASRILALVTLIIIIEFIQTIAENEFSTDSSPVFDFLLQVGIAIIVLPVESLIRKYIFKERNVQILDFVQLKNKPDKP